MAPDLVHLALMQGITKSDPTLRGCSQWPSNKAAAESKPEPIPFSPTFHNYMGA